jgi:phage terminase small subunit
MTRAEIIAELKRLNPAAPAHRIAIYADAFLLYREASDNIAKCGAITAHPRTGAPLENPYLKVRAAQSAIMMKISLKAGDLWE